LFGTPGTDRLCIEDQTTKAFSPQVRLASATSWGRMQTLIQIVLSFVAAALLLIVLVVVLAIQLIRMLAGAEEEVAEHPARETESVRHAERK
jgi:hypothetical protein